MEAGATTIMTAKLPILNPGEYDLWTSEETYEPTSAEEKLDIRNEMKARGTLLMALPNKDQLKFHLYQDAKLLMEAIKKRYGGNKESKKRNKAKLETISLDDLYNNLKIYEPELLGSSHTNQNPQNMAFISSNSPRSTNEADTTASGVSTAYTQGTTVNSTSVDNFSDAARTWDMNGQRIGFDKSKVECFNYHKNGHFVRECRALKNHDNKGREYGRKTVPVETPTENALIAQDGIGGLMIAKDGRCFVVTSEVTTDNPLLSTAGLILILMYKGYWVVKMKKKRQSETATVKVKKVNDQEQIQALVDKTKVIITKDNIRSDLRLDDVEGTACLLNEAIFEGLARMGAKTTAWNEFSSTMASAIICLADNQKFNFLKYIFDNMMKSLEGGVKFYLFLRFLQVYLDKQVEGMASHNEMYVISSHTKKIFANMRRMGAGFSGVFHLQEVKDAQAKKIAALKKKVTKLTKWKKSKSRRLGRLKKFGSGKRVKSPLVKDSLGAQEDTSKQGRMIEEIDQNLKISLDDETQGRTNDDEMFRVEDLAGEEVVMESVAEPVTIVKDSAAPITDVTKDEITMAQALAALKSVKPKVVVQEQEMSTIILDAATTITTVVPTPRAKGIVFHEQKQSHIPTVISSEDKGKAKMIEPEVPIKKKDQMRIDEKYARKLQAEEQEAAKLSRA
nr:hypothetical protein [Tanacetum cinerariifolium]